MEQVLLQEDKNVLQSTKTPVLNWNLKAPGAEACQAQIFSFRNISRCLPLGSSDLPTAFFIPSISQSTMAARIPLRPTQLRSFRIHHQSRPLSDLTLSLLTNPPVPLPILIPTATIALRTALTLPLSIYSRNISIKLLSLRPLTESWSRHLAEKNKHLPPADWDREVRRQAGKEARGIRVRHGAQVWRAYAAALSGIPVWIAASLYVRGVVAAPEGVEALKGQGFGWLMDLGVPDSTGALGVIFGALMFLNVELQEKLYPAITPSRWRAVRRNVMRCLSVAAIPVGMANPAVSGNPCESVNGNSVYGTQPSPNPSYAKKEAYRYIERPEHCSYASPKNKP